MKNGRSSLLVFGFILASAFPTFAKDRPGTLPKPIPTIRPVNVPDIPFESVTGTVTIRLNGALVNPQVVTYVFSPEFSGNAGPLKNTDWGTYFLKADNVPLERPYVITVTALYNDSVKGADGAIERRGTSYSGTAKINVPYGRDFDFGVQFLDLH